jgi:hypothetical protein
MRPRSPLMLPALRAAFGSRRFSASEIAVAAYVSGDTRLLAALRDGGARSCNSQSIGKMLAPFIALGLLTSPEWSSPSHPGSPDRSNMVQAGGC